MPLLTCPACGEDMELQLHAFPWENVPGARGVKFPRWACNNPGCQLYAPA